MPTEQRLDRPAERKGPNYRGRDGADNRQQAEVRTNSGERRESLEQQIDGKMKRGKLGKKDGTPTKTSQLQGKSFFIYSLFNICANTETDTSAYSQQNDLSETC